MVNFKVPPTLKDKNTKDSSHKSSVENSTKKLKDNKMSMRDLIGKKLSKKVKFMDSDIIICKLSVSEVMAIQEQARVTETSENKDENQGFQVLKLVIRSSAEGAAEITDEEFDKFPMDELSKLSNEIMKYSGIGGQTEGK
jgi:hypothetical protein